MLARHRTRQVMNVLNLSTPLGLLVAKLGGAEPRAWRQGLIKAHGYDFPLPKAPAFVLGNVVILRPPHGTPLHPDLLAHEERHTTQYAWSGGVLMPVLYMGACGWSWLRTGDLFARNVFERRAGLSDGGYRDVPVRTIRRSPARTRGRAGSATPTDPPAAP